MNPSTVCFFFIATIFIFQQPASARSPPLVGGFSEILNPGSDPRIQRVASEATKFLYSMFNTQRACPLYVKDIIRAREQVVAGTNYELEIQVETDSVRSDCEYIAKNCANIQVFQPLPHECPGAGLCLVPQNLNGIQCTDINLIFN